MHGIVEDFLGTLALDVQHADDVSASRPSRRIAMSKYHSLSPPSCKPLGPTQSLTPLRTPVMPSNGSTMIASLHAFNTCSLFRVTCLETTEAAADNNAGLLRGCAITANLLMPPTCSPTRQDMITLTVARQWSINHAFAGHIHGQVHNDNEGRTAR